MEKVKDTAGNELTAGDYVVVQGWRGLQPARVRTFSSSCMICDAPILNYKGSKAKMRLQPYLPNHPHTAKDENHPDRMLKVLKITQQQYDDFEQNL
tara:strand:- start:29 stop:316 length:288 start_codon:yes stop_codon:yes gene_type:complete